MGREQTLESLLDSKHERRVRHLVHDTARRFRVRIYQYANSGNHLHLLIQAKDRLFFARFLRTLTGLIARAVRKTSIANG